MSMNPFSPVGPSGGFSLTPEQQQLRINRLINGDYRRRALQPSPSGPQSGFMFESSGQNTVTVPGVGANITNESELARLLRLRSLLDPMSQAMWDADPRNQAEIARLRREEAGLPPEAIPRQPGDNSPSQPPPGGWGDTNTYEDIFGPAPTPPPGTDTTAALVAWINTLTPAQRVQWSKSPRTAGQIRALNQEGYTIDLNGNLTTPVAPPPPAPPQRPGTVPGSVWNNPESEAPRGYNPELWAQREIGPNRTYQGGITGLGIGGPTNADGTAMYTAPAEIKPTREVDPFGYEPANLFQREKFEGQFSGGPDVLSNAQGDSFERNLLSSIAEAINSTDPAVSERAKFIMAAASNPAVLRDMPFRRNGPANLIDRAGYQYDMQNGGGPQRRQSQSTDTGKDSMDREKRNPFMPRMASGTVVPPGPRAAQEILRAQAQRARDANGIGGLAPTPGPRAAQEILRAAAQRQMDAANPFMSSFAESTRRMPVYTMPSERVPMPMQRGPAAPGRLPIQSGPVAGPLPIVSGPVVAPAPNPFLGGGASRGYRNPFR